MKPLARQTEPIIDAAYLAASGSQPTHFLMHELEKRLPPEPGLAIDIGFGAGSNALWLATKGWSIWGVDASPLAVDAARERLDGFSNVVLVEGDMLRTPFPKCDLAIATFSLFMAPRQRFPALWKRLKASVRPGGLIVVSLLGDRDEWNDGERTVHSARGAKALFRDFETLYWVEHEREGKTVIDLAKYWHAFHVIARKRA